MSDKPRCGIAGCDGEHLPQHHNEAATPVFVPCDFVGGVSLPCDDNLQNCSCWAREDGARAERQRIRKAAKKLAVIFHDSERGYSREFVSLGSLMDAISSTEECIDDTQSSTEEGNDD